MKNLIYSKIELNGAHLQSAYGVYIIEVNHPDSKTFYYVGQTGDTKIISARSPFYRLAAHLGYRKDKQNQIYEGLKKKLKKKSREEMEKWFAIATLKIHFFKTADFEFCYAKEKSENYKKFKEKKHTPLRRETLALETALLQTIKDKKLSVLNEKNITYRKYEASMESAKKIWAKIGIEL